jgi:WD40 repeat protein/Tfp pilus assembly protein PilF
MKTCPSPEQFRQLEANQLSGPEAEALEAHIEACASCQQALEQMDGITTARIDHHSDDADGAARPRAHKFSPAATLEERGEDFLRWLEKQVPPGAWIFPNSARGTEPPAAACVNRVTAAADPPTIAGYEIVGRLGRGGMGVVFQAWQQKLNRIVALKMVLAGAHARPEEIARFRVEIEAVARLQHPNIVQIYEVGEQDGLPFFAMEYADGGSLAQKLLGTPFSVRRAAQLAEQLARAIHAAHERGIVHRDLTPANVLFAGDGAPKITDFGLAKILIGGGVTQTQTGLILGTPNYMPPEQAEGRTRDVTPATDVYALGAILYEMLTGRPPFRGETPQETVRQVMTDEPVPPRRLRPRVAVDLETICLKCLQKEPHKRYSSALELADDLQRFLVDKPIAARRTGLPERTWRWCRRNPVVAALTAFVGLLLVTVALVSSVSAVWLRDQRNDATEKLWGSYLAQARAGRFSRRQGQRFESLKALKQAVAIGREMKMQPTQFLELRNEAIACLALPDLRLALEWDGWPSGSLSVDFDGALERYARADRQGNVSIRRMPGDLEIARLTGSGAQSWLLFSFDGQYLAVTLNNGTKLWKMTEPEPTMVLEERTGVTALNFSPDGQRFAIGHADGSISLYDLAAGQQRRRLRPGPAPGHLAFHPKRRQLAVACDSSILVRDLDSDQVLAELTQAARPYCVAWHPGGEALAVVCDDSRIYLWDVPTRKQTLVLEGHKNKGITIAFNHAGDLLASNGWEGMLRLWDARTGRQLFSTQSGIQIPRFSPDDRRLAVDRKGNQLRLWDVAAGREYRTLVRDAVHGRGLYYGGAISPDGRFLAVGMRDGFGLWDLASGNNLAFVTLDWAAWVLFEPSGTLLTNAPAGLLRWPIQADPASPALLQLGPPQKLPLPGSTCQIAGSQDGQVVASAQSPDQGGLVLHLDRPKRLLRLAPHGDVRSIAVSPDGRLVATGSHSGTQVKIWQAQGGRLVKQLSVEYGSRVAFSPDGKWLATGGDGCRLWEVGSWQEGARMGENERASFAFSPDSKLRATEMGHGVVRLVDPDTGHEYARLEDPNQDRAGWLGFSPDGTQLIATNNDSQSIHVWDLWAIRRQLGDMGLDWDLPSAEPAARPTGAEALKMSVELGTMATALEPPGNMLIKYTLAAALLPINPEAYYRRGLAQARLGQLRPALEDCNLAVLLHPGHADTQLLRGRLFVALGQPSAAIAALTSAIQHRPQEANYYQRRAEIHVRVKDYALAMADWRHVISLEPENAMAHNNLAWFYVTGPAELRAADTALPLAQKAMDLEMDSTLFRNTLGVVYYRLARYPDAVACFEKNLSDDQEFAAFDLFFLAMSYHRLNELAKAKDCYERARQWWQTQSDLPVDQREELKSFQAEAEAVLRKAKP